MRPRQEDDELRARSFAFAAVVVLAVTGAATLAAWWVGARRQAELGGGSVGGSARQDAPREVEGTPMALFSDPEPPSRVEAEAHLEAYGWVDEEAGIVHVPIDVAIDLYLERPPTEPPP